MHSEPILPQLMNWIQKWITNCPLQWPQSQNKLSQSHLSSNFCEKQCFHFLKQCNGRYHCLYYYCLKLNSSDSVNSNIMVLYLNFSYSSHCISSLSLSFGVLKFWSYISLTIWKRHEACLHLSHSFLSQLSLLQKAMFFLRWDGLGGWVSSGGKLILWRQGIKCNGGNVQTHQFHFSRLTVSHYITTCLSLF